jgi:hypothetical protein
MAPDQTSPSDSPASPMRVSGRLFVIILIPVIILAFGWLIYARMNFRGASPPQPTVTKLP